MRWKFPFVVSRAGAAGFRSVGSMAWSVGLLQLLSGCILGSEKPELAVEIPPAYLAGGRAPEAALPSPEWWRGFRSPELSELIEEAQVANFDIAAAVGRILQADAQSRIAGAPLLPNVDLNADATRSRSSQTTSPSGTGGGGPSERTIYSASLSASYEIDFWGKNQAALRAAEENAVASRFDREVVNLTTVAAVANAYFQVLAAQDRLRVARQNQASASRILTLIQQRLSVGTASSLEIAQQESLVATQRASIPPLEQLLRQNIAALAVLVGRPAEFFGIRGGSMSRLSFPRVTPGLPSELLTQRPDIREAEALLAGASANVESARAAFFPSINLTAEGGYQSAALKLLFRPESAFYSVAAGLTQPIFDGLRLQGQLDLQRGKQEELLQKYRKAVVSAFADVETALVAIQQTALRERLQRAVVAASRRAFDISETRLREGTVDLITSLTTQQNLFQAEDNLAQARLAHLQAIVSLFQALGGGWLSRPPAAAATGQAL